MPDPWSLTQAEMVRLGIIAKTPTQTHVNGASPPANLVKLDDAVCSLRKIATALGLHRPPTKYDMARYMYGEPLQFDPGAQNFNTTNGNSYSNFGYLLLGLVVEERSGMPFVDFLRDHVLKPDG